MAEPHVLTGLMAKRAEIAGQIEHLQDQLRQLVIDLVHSHLRPQHRTGGDQGAARAGAAFRGQVTRTVLTTLRNAKKPLTTQDIAMRVMAERGLDTANERLLKTHDEARWRLPVEPAEAGRGVSPAGTRAVHVVGDGVIAIRIAVAGLPQTGRIPQVVLST